MYGGAAFRKSKLRAQRLRPPHQTQEHSGHCDDPLDNRLSEERNPTKAAVMVSSIASLRRLSVLPSQRRRHCQRSRHRVVKCGTQPQKRRAAGGRGEKHQDGRVGCAGTWSCIDNIVQVMLLVHVRAEASASACGCALSRGLGFAIDFTWKPIEKGFDQVSQDPQKLCTREPSHSGTH